MVSKSGAKSQQEKRGSQKAQLNAPGTLLKVSSLYASLKQSESILQPYFPLIASSSQQAQASDIISSELNVARMLNISMPDDPHAFIGILEARIQEITQTRKNVILILDEVSGTYTCLNDEANADFAQAPRELTWISDTYLQDLLDSDHVQHTFLEHEGNVFGIIAVADKLDGSAFSLRDEMLLEQVAQYLSVQVKHYLALKELSTLPTTQKILLNISTRLLSAVDSESIYLGALSSLLEQMPFTAGQYIRLDRNTGEGHVLYQLANQQFIVGEPILKVDSFAALVSLFQSNVWKHNCLYLKGSNLGDKAFSNLFGLPDISSVVLVPMLTAEKQIEGALVLFQQGDAINVSKDGLTIVEQVADLVTSACERARILEKALEIATMDELTGAVNRRGFYSRFEGEVERSRRNQAPMCLAMIDADHFKQINDTYGHLIGDRILQELAAHIFKNIRKSDLLCRFGGEEFALLLPDTNLQAGADLLERLRVKLEKITFKTPAGRIKVTFSAGVSAVHTDINLSKDSMEIISESLADADEALYKAKESGRNKVVVA